MLIEFTQYQMYTFSDYEPPNELGSGGFGPVYKGWLRLDGLECDIAIKVSKEVTSDAHWESLRAQCEAEIHWLHRLDHPNIIKLKGYCRNLEERKLYLVYEYMAGGTLKQRQSGLDWPGILNVLKGIASALKYIHAYFPGNVRGDFPGLVYGDLKPENILFGQDGEPKITDFGTMTKVDETLPAFTVGYIVPTAHGLAYRTKQAYDVYSFGVVMLQLIMKKDEVVQPEGEGSVTHPLIADWAKEEAGRKGYVVNKEIAKTGCSRSDAVKITNLALYCTNERTEVRSEGPLVPNFNEILETLQQLKVTTTFGTLKDLAKNSNLFHH